MDNREQKISDNIGLVHACAKRFKSRGIEYDDLFQAGCLGLVKAVDGFDDDRGVKFSTYAVPVILGEMKRLFRDGGAVKVGRALKELSLKATKATADFTAKEGRVPTVQELAEILEVSVSELLGAKIENENTASDVAEQLSRINEQLAIKNRRSRRIWKIVAIILAAIILINIFIAVFFSVPTLNEGIQSNQPEIIDQTQIIEE